MARWSGSILYVAGIQVVRVYTAMRSWWSGLVWIYTLRDLGSPSLVWIYTLQRAARSGLGSRTQFFSRALRARKGLEALVSRLLQTRLESDRHSDVPPADSHFFSGTRHDEG